jgi:hypothetical protein
MEQDILQVSPPRRHVYRLIFLWCGIFDPQNRLDYSPNRSGRDPPLRVEANVSGILGFHGYHDEGD